MTYKELYNILWKKYRAQVRKVEREGYELPKKLLRVKNKKPNRKAVESLEKLIKSQAVLKEALTVHNGKVETRSKAIIRKNREKREQSKKAKVVSASMVEEYKHKDPDVRALWMRLNKSLREIASLDHMSASWYKNIFGDVERWWHTHSDEDILETLKSNDIDWDAFDIVAVSSDGEVYHSFLKNIEEVELPKLLGYQPKVTQSDYDRLSPEQAALVRGYSDGTDEVV